MPNVLAPTVERVAELGDLIRELTNERDELKNHLAANLDVGTHLIEGWQVIVKLPEPRWSAPGKRKFEATHPSEDYPELYALALDTKAADTVLTALEREAYLLTPKRSVTVV
jgi:hypothetical protein